MELPASRLRLFALLWSRLELDSDVTVETLVADTTYFRLLCNSAESSPMGDVTDTMSIYIYSLWFYQVENTYLQYLQSHSHKGTDILPAGRVIQCLSVSEAWRPESC